MKQNGLEYEEIEKLMSIIIKKEAEIIEDKKIGCCEVEEKKVELIFNTTKKDAEIIEDKMVDDIKMPKSSRRLVLPKKILKVIARERGVKNYENLSKSELIKEINKLKPAKAPKKTGSEKILSDGYAKKDELKRKDIGLIKEKKH